MTAHLPLLSGITGLLMLAGMALAVVLYDPHPEVTW